MPKKGHGQLAGRAIGGHAGNSRTISPKIHPSHRTWYQLPVRVMVCILASLPGVHRRSRVKLAHMTTTELWHELKSCLRLKAQQCLPSRDTIQVILDAIIQSYTVQGLSIPPVQLLDRAFDYPDWADSADCFHVLSSPDSLRWFPSTWDSLLWPQQCGRSLPFACAK